MAMLTSARALSPRSLSRRSLFAAPAVLLAGDAAAQSTEITFKKSSLVIVTGGREIKFDVELALTEARQLAGHAGVVVVTGSIFLAAEARSLLTDTPAVPRAANA